MTGSSNEIDRRYYERLFKERGFCRIAGVDEVGRGPLAGPVVACAVILPDEFLPDGVDDSKLLSPARRLDVFPRIAQGCLAWAIGVADAETIDRMNILRASLLAMRLALDDLPVKPDAVIVDGNHKIPEVSLPQMPVIKGDQKSLSVACASILAKEIRDRIMEEYDIEYPDFGFAIHKGYATAEHLQALEKLGPTPIHRRTFRTVRENNQGRFDL
jgi:ribonuclease HII